MIPQHGSFSLLSAFNFVRCLALFVLLSFNADGISLCLPEPFSWAQLSSISCSQTDRIVVRKVRLAVAYDQTRASVCDRQPITEQDSDCVVSDDDVTADVISECNGFVSCQKSLHQRVAATHATKTSACIAGPGGPTSVVYLNVEYDCLMGLHTYDLSATASYSNVQPEMPTDSRSTKSPPIWLGVRLPVWLIVAVSVGIGALLTIIIVVCVVLARRRRRNGRTANTTTNSSRAVSRSNSAAQQVQHDVIFAYPDIDRADDQQRRKK